MIDVSMTVLKWLIGAGVCLWAAFLALDWIGPTEPVDLTFPEVIVPAASGVAPWLTANEAFVPNLRANAAKQIVWAGQPGARTPLALVYLHGFSADPAEVRPLPDAVAEGLGANLYLTRLTGHGRDSAAMAEPAVADWVADVAEAIAIGRSIGERVIVMGNSTGATLAVLAASDRDLARDIAGLVLMSPNMRVAGWGGRIMEWPGARAWGPMLIGPERAFTPVNDRQAAHWTTSYPTSAIAVLGALTHSVRRLPAAEMTVPALFVMSETDRVIDVPAALRTLTTWGGPTELFRVPLGPNDDPAGHVLAGDILSPDATPRVSERILLWARGL